MIPRLSGQRNGTPRADAVCVVSLRGAAPEPLCMERGVGLKRALEVNPESTAQKAHRLGMKMSMKQVYFHFENLEYSFASV